MPRPKTSPQKNEQNSFQVFDPSNIKQSVEIPVKPKPTVEELETVEIVGKKVRKKVSRSTKKKAVKKSNEKSPAHFEEKKLKKDGYVLIITEKPQAASKIAAALGEGKRNKFQMRCFLL
jgi:hypothetical protein